MCSAWALHWAGLLAAGRMYDMGAVLGGLFLKLLMHEYW